MNKSKRIYIDTSVIEEELNLSVDIIPNNVLMKYSRKQRFKEYYQQIM